MVSQRPKEPSEEGVSQGGRKQQSPDQRNKVFVGGVPQDYNQDDLRRLFSRFAPVKRAWVQQHKTKRCTTERSPPQNHRGFGWVVFQDAASKKGQHDGEAGQPAPTSHVDHFLGDSASRWVDLGDGRRVEVKRAKDAQEMKELQDASSTTSASSTEPHPSHCRPMPPPAQAIRGLGLVADRVVGGQGPPGMGWPTLGPMRPPPPGLPPPPAPGTLLPADGRLPPSRQLGAGLPPRDASYMPWDHSSMPLSGHGRGTPVRVPYPPPRPTGAEPAYVLPVRSDQLIAKESGFRLPLAEDTVKFVESES